MNSKRIIFNIQRILLDCYGTYVFLDGLAVLLFVLLVGLSANNGNNENDAENLFKSEIQLESWNLKCKKKHYDSITFMLMLLGEEENLVWFRENETRAFIFARQRQLKRFVIAIPAVLQKKLVYRVWQKSCCSSFVWMLYFLRHHLSISKGREHVIHCKSIEMLF